MKSHDALNLFLIIETTIFMILLLVNYSFKLGVIATPVINCTAGCQFSYYEPCDYWRWLFNSRLCYLQ